MAESGEDSGVGDADGIGGNDPATAPTLCEFETLSLYDSLLRGVALICDVKSASFHLVPLPRAQVHGVTIGADYRLQE